MEGSSMVVDMTQCGTGLSSGLEIKTNAKRKRKRNFFKNEDTKGNDPKGTLIIPSLADVQPVLPNPVGPCLSTDLKMTPDKKKKRKKRGRKKMKLLSDSISLSDGALTSSLAMQEVVKPQSMDIVSGVRLAKSLTKKVDDHIEIDSTFLEVNKTEAPKRNTHNRKRKKKKKKSLTNSISISNRASPSTLVMQEVVKPQSTNCGLGECLTASLTKKLDDHAQIDSVSLEVKKAEAPKRNTHNKKKKKLLRNSVSLSGHVSSSTLVMQEVVKTQNVDCGSGEHLALNITKKADNRAQVESTCLEVKKVEAPKRNTHNKKKKKLIWERLASNLTKKADNRAQVESTCLEEKKVEALKRKTHKKKKEKLVRDLISLNGHASSSTLATQKLVKPPNMDCGSGERLAASLTEKLDDHAQIDNTSLEVKKAEAPKRNKHNKKKKKLLRDSSSLNDRCLSSTQAMQEVVKSQKVDCGSGGHLAASVTKKVDDHAQIDSNYQEGKKTEALKRNTHNKKKFLKDSISVNVHASSSTLRMQEVVKSQKVDCGSGGHLAASVTKKVDDHAQIDSNYQEAKKSEAPKRNTHNKKKSLRDSISVNVYASSSTLPMQEVVKSQTVESGGHVAASVTNKVDDHAQIDNNYQEAKKAEAPKRNTHNKKKFLRDSISVNAHTSSSTLPMQEVVKSQKVDCGSGGHLTASVTKKTDDHAQIDSNYQEAKKTEAPKRNKHNKKKKLLRDSISLNGCASPSALVMEESSGKDSPSKFLDQAPASVCTEEMREEVLCAPCSSTVLKMTLEEAGANKLQIIDSQAGKCLAAYSTENLDDHHQVDSTSLEEKKRKALKRKRQRKRKDTSGNSCSLSDSASPSTLIVQETSARDSSLGFSVQVPASAYREEMMKEAATIPEPQFLIKEEDSRGIAFSGRPVGETAPCDQEEENKTETLEKHVGEHGSVNNSALDISETYAKESDKDKLEMENCSLILMSLSSSLSETTGDVIQANRENEGPRLDLLGVNPGVLRKKLLVLDLNGILADIVDSYPKEYKPDMFISRKAVFKRPFCEDFLQFCFEKFHVGVWSSRTWRNVELAVNFLMKRFKSKLLFCWSQTHCTKTGFKTIENKDKPMVLKELRKLWEKHEPGLPWNRGDYNESNTLLLDDSPYKALRNPPYTAIFPNPYSCRHREDNSVGPGGDLRVYLEGLALANNVQEYVEANPFGQLAITEKHSSWNFYRKVIDRHVIQQEQKSRVTNCY